MRHVPRVRPMSRTEVERHAEMTRRAYCFRRSPELLKEPGRIDVVRFFEFIDDFDPDLVPSVEPLEPGYDGLSSVDGKVAVSPPTYEAACSGKPRARFTLAHECAHGLVHVRQMSSQLMSPSGPLLHDERSIEVECNPEWQANVWAEAFLMPGGQIDRILQRGHLLAIERVMSAFGVSRTAALNRLRSRANSTLENRERRRQRELLSQQRV